jgi:hypothetical protein
MRNALFGLAALVALPLAGCSNSGGMGSPTVASVVSPASSPSASSAPSAIPVGAPAREVSAGQALAHSEGLTDLTLANAGWTCIEPGNSLVLCGPPGLGLPSIPPAADGRPTYDIMAFTLDHQFVHRVKLRRPDLYHGEPCQGGDSWAYLDFLNYYECIIPSGGE